jgi:festuclavine dehydrogenase
MTTLLLPGSSKTALAVATNFHLASPSIPYLLGLRDPFSSSSRNLAHPTLSLPLDLSVPATWDPFFTDASPPITTLYLVPPSNMKDFVPACKDFLTFATSHGVTRVLWLSSSIIERGGPAHGQVHAHLHALANEPDAADGTQQKLQYAVLRPTWFAENFTSASNFHVPSIRAEGKIYSATGEGKVPWVSISDIGAVGYHALTHPEGASREGREYLILGPELLSYDAIARELGEVLGREIRHEKMTVEELTERFVTGEMQMERKYAAVLAGLDGLIASGAEERLGGCVEEVTGRAGRGAREVFEEAKEMGAWD